MIRGRKPKPGAIRDLQGNPGKRPINREAPKLPTLRDVPDPPAYLTGHAREQWLEVAGMLVTAGVLTGGDLHILECLCLAYQQLRESDEHVAKHGVVVGTKRTGFRKNPAVTARGEAMRQVRDFSALLGLDPSSRMRLHVVGAQPASKVNPFSVLPGGKASA